MAFKLLLFMLASVLACVTSAIQSRNIFANVFILPPHFMQSDKTLTEDSGNIFDVLVKPIRRLVEQKGFRKPTETQEKVENCYNFLKEFSKGKVIYGLNTGLGPMAQYKIGKKKQQQLQYNLIRSHSAGTGPPISDIYVKSLI